VTLSGTGALTMTVAGGGGNAYIQQAVGGITLTNQSTIQGAGIIGNGGLTLINSGTINANAPTQVLYVNPGGGITNTGLMEAGSGGVLQIAGDVVYGGGNITANSGSTVQLFGNTDIVGGTLTNNGSFLGTPINSNAYLDGSTGAGAITINGTYTSDTNSVTYLLGNIHNYDKIQVNGGSGYNSIIDLNSNVTLWDGGTVNMTVNGGGGSAYVQQAVGGVTLTNVNNLIQGAGVIGNGGLTLVNEATIDANSFGQTLLLNASGGVTNSGLLEASNGGYLQIDGITVNNGGANITAKAGSTVQIFGSAVIQGGTLTNNANFFGTPANNVAYLDGSTGAGAITINGTYTSDTNSETYLLGTINNHGNILLNGGSGYNAFLFPDTSNVTLQGGGTVTLVTLGGGGSAYIMQPVGGVTLENFNNTIQGAGIIGNGGLSVLNDAGGTFLANAPGQNLYINASGTITNNGTFQVNPTSALIVQNGTFTNFGGSTLAGGSYVMNNGTLQIDELGVNGKEIQTLGDGTQPTSVVLNGANAAMVDSGGFNALSLFTVSANASLTLENGANMTTPGNLSNFGSIKVGTAAGGSTLTIGTVSVGVVLNGGPLNPGPINNNLFNETGGVISGGGTIAGTVSNAGTITASDPGSPDILTINGDYTQGSTGTLEAFLGGAAPGTGYSQLVVNGTATLDGTLDVSLISSFFPTSGESFFLLDSSSSVVDAFSTLDLPTLPNGDSWDVTYNTSCPQGSVGCVDLTFEGSPTTTPEPSIFLLLAAGIGMMTLLRKYRNTARREMA
jgi:hypothetical protein